MATAHKSVNNFRIKIYDVTSVTKIQVVNEDVGFRGWRGWGFCVRDVTSVAQVDVLLGNVNGFYVEEVVQAAYLKYLLFMVQSVSLLILMKEWIEIVFVDFDWSSFLMKYFIKQQNR